MRSTIVVLAAAALHTGCEQPLKPTSANATLTEMAIACEPRSGTPTTHAYCPVWACFSDRSIQAVTAVAAWQSSDPAVATVDRGVVEFHSPGEVSISATFSWRGGAPVTGTHKLTITSNGCTVDPSRNRCTGAPGGIPGVIAPGTCSKFSGAG